MIGSPPWWAILAFGLASAALLMRQYLNGTMAAANTGGKWAGYAVVGVLCILYGLRRGRSVGFRLFGEYGGGGYAVVSAASRIPVTRLVLHSLFWGIFLWSLSRMIPHAAGRELLLLVLLLFAGSFPFARQMSLLEWSQKSETERDRNRGNRSLFGGGVLVLVSLNPGQLMPDHLISPNRWAYLLAGLICLLIGLNYRGSGLSRWLGAGAPTPGKDDFPVFQPVSVPMRRGALKAKVEPLVAIVAAVRSGAQVIQTSPLAEPTSQPDAGLQRNDAAEFEFRQPEPLPEVAYEDSYRAAYSGFRPLFLVLGLSLLLYTVHLWRDYIAHDGYGGVMTLILAVFNSVVTLLGIVIFGRALRRPGKSDTSD